MSLAAQHPSQLGPYERWVFGEDLGKPFAVPASIRRDSQYQAGLIDNATVPADSETALLMQAGPKAAGAFNVRVPPLWHTEGDGQTIWPIAIDESEAPKANPLALPADVRIRLNFPISRASWTGDYQPQERSMEWKKTARRPKAIIGVIDDGLPFAQRCFLNSVGKTRIDYCWLQSARAEEVAAVPFGREFTNGEIDELRKSYGHDEDLLYREAGAVDTDLTELRAYLNRHTTHGSHVMSLAAGTGIGPDADVLDDDIHIVAVQLPTTISWDASGFGKEMYMLSAVHYILERAKRIAQEHDPDGAELPLVINFSYGWSGGRHDGDSEMEAALEKLVQLRKKQGPTELVMPSGNTFANRMNAQIEERHFEDGAVELNWHILPDDRTSSYVEFWFPPKQDVSGYSLEVEPPAGHCFDQVAILPVTAPVPAAGGTQRAYLDFTMDGKIIGQIGIDKNRGTRWRAMVAIAPTSATPGTCRRSPVGSWTLRLTRSKGQVGLGSNAIWAWVQRDDDPVELRTGGQQSYLSDPKSGPENLPALPHYPQDLGIVSGFGSLNGVATGPSTVRVAGVDGKTLLPASYSSAGGLRKTGAGLEPVVGDEHVTLSARSDRSPSQPGTVSHAARSGSRSVLTGTSVAAPVAARHMLRNLANGRDAMAGLLSWPPGLNPNEPPAKPAHLEARRGKHLIPL